MPEPVQQNEKEPSADAPGSFPFSQDDIDAALRHGSGYENGKLRIYALYQHDPTKKDAVKFLKNEYGTYGHSHTFLDGSWGFVDYSSRGAVLRHSDPAYEQKLTWSVVDRRLRELVASGQYLTEEEMAQYRELEREYAGVPGGVPTPHPRYGFPSPEEVRSGSAEKEPPLQDGYVTEIIRYDVGRGRTWADLFAQFPSVQNESTRTELLRAHFGEVFTGFYAQDHTMIGFHGSASGLELWQGEYLSAYARMNLSWSEVARLVDREIAADIDRFQTEAAPVVETPPPPAPAMDPQEAIDNAIREWNGSIESKQAVVRYMESHAREKGTAAWLRNEYGDDLPAFPVTSDAITKDIPWPKVQRRIAQLIAEDHFYTETELDRFDDIDPVAIREELERRQAQGTSPFVEMVMADVERIAAREEQEAAEQAAPIAETVEWAFAYGGYHFVPAGVLGEDFDPNDTIRHTISHNELGMSTYADAQRPYTHADFYAAANNSSADVFRCVENGKLYLPGTNELFEFTGTFKPYAELAAPTETPPAPDLSDKPITRQGDTITIGDGPATHEITAKVTDDEWEQIQAAIPEQDAPAFDPLAPAYRIGTRVYIDDKPYEVVQSYDTYVVIWDISMQNAPRRMETVDAFAKLIRQDPRNSHVTEVLPANLNTTDMDLQDALVWDGGLLDQEAKDRISGWIREGVGNTEIARRLAETYAGVSDTMMLQTGEGADYFATPTGFEINISDKYDTKLSFRWDEIAPVLRAMFIQEQDGFSHGPDLASRRTPRNRFDPPVREIYAQYFPVVRDMVMGDIYYQNACKNSDRENAMLEGRAAVQRAVRSIDDPAFMRAFYDNTAFHNRLCAAVFQQTYPVLSQPAAEAEPIPQEAPPEPEQSAPDFDPLAPPYKVGDTVYLDNTLFEITEVGDFDVQLRDPSLYFPIFRSENKENFAVLLRQDSRNGAITEFLPAEPDSIDPELQDGLAADYGLLDIRAKERVSGWIRAGESNTRIAQRLAEMYAGTTGTLTLHTGETADFFATTTGFEVETHDASRNRLIYTWGDVSPVLRAMYIRESDGFSPEPAAQEPVRLEGEPDYHVGDHVTVPTPDRDISGTIGYVGETDVRVDTGPYAWSSEVINRDQFEESLRQDERNADLFTPEAEQKPLQRGYTTEHVATFPAEPNNMPYDIVIERINFDEPEHTPPEPTAQNFHITDDALGVGGPKAKFRANMEAITLLKELEFDGRQATPEEQEVLSRYVGWGALADAFDENKPNWANEFIELYTVLSPEEYRAARASTLNAHYTSPTVIKAIYEAVERMGFQAGNILEPACGVGNFFGCLPESMAASKLYGVELDPITGRIAKQLYPQADITVAGFETTDRRNFYDLAVGNVPFGSYQVNDPAYNKLGFSIHDYFFAKTLDQVRPGGVIAFVTSRYTMDKQSPDVRHYIAERADLLGAIRLPNNAFLANAGTGVVSDIIFLQKRDRPQVTEPDWVHLGQNADGFAINSYFIDHPEMVLGRMSSESTQYGKEDFTVEPIEGLELADQLHDAVKYIHGQYQEAELPELGEGEEIDTSIPADPNVRNYSYTVVDGEVYYRENSRMVKPDLSATAKARIRGMIELRDCTRQLIDLQMEDSSDADIQKHQAELNRLYDRFTARYGLINSRANAQVFADDSSYYLLCSLEVLDEDGRLERKADMFTKRTIKRHAPVTSVDTASEALAVSISEKARVDMPFMCQLTGKDEQTLFNELQGVIYMDFGPWTDSPYVYRTADEFLSGNIRSKVQTYENALAMLPQDHPRRPIAEANLKALQAAMPKDLEASEIDVRLGATWVDPDYIQQFMYETFDTPFYLQRNIQVQFSSFTAEWRITGKSSIAYNNVAAYTTYGTERANAYRILEDTLNLRDVRIYDTVQDPDGKEKRVLNQKETTLAQQKQQAIKDAFQEWVWKDPARRQKLVRKYNDLFNSNRIREYDGSHITFGGMSPEIELREHQKNAIAHILYGGNTLLAHEVGAGKTFEMAAAAMESKRLGLCSKSLFVVPNHLTEQWASEFLRLYPSANILVTTKKDFETRNRKKFCSRIATGDYDAIIIGHSQFEKIPVSLERQERLLEQQIDEIEEGIAELKEQNAEHFTIKAMERTRKSLEARLDKLTKRDRKDDVVTFEELGVDRLFVDEAHAFKNLFLFTKMRNVAGLSTSDAQKSSDMFLKCRYMDEQTGSKGVVFATGTPVSNSMTELYTMMRYLQYDMLQDKGLIHFDNWASTFGETTTAIELAPEGTGYRARTRFSKFFNLPELMTLWKEAADIKTADQLHLPVPEAIFHNEVSKPTELQQQMVQELSERASAVHAHLVDPSKDNMLRITGDGRKLGLDQRVLNPLLPDDPRSKVNKCVDNIVRIWQDGQADKLTQLVFCDISTPKAAPSRKDGKQMDNPELNALEALALPAEGDKPFNVYDDIRDKLIARGIPAEQIAFIHDANTEAKKKELFSKVRKGQVRVLMGSTFKMGAGMNVQDRLIALHDLDCPWRPGDLEQRKGRIVRQGNNNPTVHIYRYVTEGTFDSYLWQTVETKQKFISQIMTSKSPVRSCEDIDETALSYAEIKALCAGDPRIKEKMDLDIDVSRLKLLRANHQNQQYRLQDRLLQYFPEEIEKNKGYIAGFEKDIATLAASKPPEGKFAGMVVRGDTLTDKDNAGAAILEACKEIMDGHPVEIGSYRGMTMFISFERFQHHITLKGEMSYKTELGDDARGNLTRIENALANAPDRLNAVKAQLDNLYQQQAAAQAELGKPFPQEAEYLEKSSRLAQLNAELNIESPDPAQTFPEQAAAKSERPPAVAKSERPSVLAKLRDAKPALSTVSRISHHKQQEER